MEHIVDYLGLALPFQLSKMSPNGAIVARRRNCDCHVLSLDSKMSEYEEDETEVTSCGSLDITETSFSSDDDSSTLTKSVSFAKPMVTAVAFRPAVTQAEKRAMFYRDADYRLFRKDFHSGMPPRDLNVSFDTNVTVHSYECEADDQDLYYSQQDLRRFLDGFIASLRE